MSPATWPRDRALDERLLRVDPRSGALRDARVGRSAGAAPRGRSARRQRRRDPARLAPRPRRAASPSRRASSTARRRRPLPRAPLRRGRRARPHGGPPAPAAARPGRDGHLRPGPRGGRRARLAGVAPPRRPRLPRARRAPLVGALPARPPRAVRLRRGPARALARADALRVAPLVRRAALGGAPAHLGPAPRAAAGRRDPRVADARGRALLYRRSRARRAACPLPERFDIPEETAQAIRATRAAGGRVVAVGTTVTRALEGCAAQHGGEVHAGRRRHRSGVCAGLPAAGGRRAPLGHARAGGEPLPAARSVRAAARR